VTVDLAERFECERPRLLRIAYATTGSWSEAEDCVQEAWLRLRRVDAVTIDNLQAWLVTTVSRLALDALGSARARRERYVGTWLPEPVVEPSEAVADPADRVTLDESVSMALLVVLERLSPPQRAAFVLHDVFGLGFDEIGDVVGRSPAAVRQLASRGRREVRAARTPTVSPVGEQRRVVNAFLAACRDGDLPGLVALLDPGVVTRADGGGKVSAMRDELRGPDHTATVLLGFLRRPPELMVAATVNGSPGIVVRDGTGVLSIAAFTVVDGKITEIYIVRNPEKLSAVTGWFSEV
jgi:RNA polymerase sigma-70 factor (ECF subfamily)